jgi:hypothetical protein
MEASNWMIIVFGLAGIVSGVRAIRKRYVNTDVDEYQGESAVRWGVLWIMLGSLFILAAIFDVRWFKELINLFFSS